MCSDLTGWLRRRIIGDRLFVGGTKHPILPLPTSAILAAARFRRPTAVGAKLSAGEEEKLARILSVPE